MLLDVTIFVKMCLSPVKSQFEICHNKSLFSSGNQKRLMPSFSCVTLKIIGSQVTTDARRLACRELDEALGLTEMGAEPVLAAEKPLGTRLLQQRTALSPGYRPKPAKKFHTRLTGGGPQSY